MSEFGRTDRKNLVLGTAGGSRANRESVEADLRRAHTAADPFFPTFAGRRYLAIFFVETVDFESPM
jgi:hypothetical protein